MEQNDFFSRLTMKRFVVQRLPRKSSRFYSGHVAKYREMHFVCLGQVEIDDLVKCIFCNLVRPDWFRKNEHVKKCKKLENRLDRLIAA